MDRDVTALIGFLDSAAESATSYKGPGQGQSGDAVTLAAIVPHLNSTASALAGLAGRLAAAPSLGKESRAALGETASALQQAAARVLEHLADGLDAARARAAESAWDLGIKDARAGRTPFADYTPDTDGYYADHVYDDARAAEALARSLETAAGDDDSVMETARCSYADAYGEIAGTAYEGETLRYRAEQVVITASGRQGKLTGESARSGHPMVTFDSADPVPLARAAIPGPLVMEFASPAEAESAASGSGVIEDGDVLLVPSIPAASIYSARGDGFLHPGPYAASIDHGRYAGSVRLAADAVAACKAAKSPVRRRPAASLNMAARPAGSAGRASR